ncbi:DUF2252 domain-containing protein [Pengzhenrongella frigida]|uniref:DUF2252 domain-containing protein n=1 Tax=Pengzhenrongella frigida TaxID=1259133 RepID=A0A4Q5N2E8_9MICO|nr:DUF2252 domain-containing protein [Cellulomonas sp. HLT2-17]RYV52352.1 DUF2252 domain-containing protein [Cellulomonas sp. HLT2-17]
MSGPPKATALPELPDPDYLPKRTLSERVAHGRELRAQLPHERQATWTLSPTRADPLAILDRQSAERIEDLVPIRYGRMAASPFAFFRGGAAIMAADLAGTPTSGLRAQLCGDAHLLNFGMFDTPERSLVFGLNDFDETLPGPIEWDVKRLAASVEVAARDLQFGRTERHAAVLATVRSYRAAMAGFAALRNVEVWTRRLPAKTLERQMAIAADHQTQREVRKAIRKALSRDSLTAFERLIEAHDGALRFRAAPPLVVPVEALLDQHERERYVEVMSSFLEQYRGSLPPHLRYLVESYRFARMARKVVGVGSVGTRAWVVLLIGRDASDPLLLQLKEAKPSVLEPYAGPSVYETQGRRVVEGQRFMQTASDPLLGWYRLRALDDQMHDFYVRQLWDGKSSIDVARLSPAGLVAYGEACGWTLARGHARSGDRIALAAFLGEDAAFDDAIAAFAATYADVNESDHRRLVAAIASGRVPAVSGV